MTLPKSRLWSSFSLICLGSGENCTEVCVPKELPNWYHSVPLAHQGHDQKEAYKYGAHGTSEGEGPQGRKPARFTRHTPPPTMKVSAYLQYYHQNIHPTSFDRKRPPWRKSTCPHHTQLPLSYTQLEVEFTQMAFSACSQHHSVLSTKSLRCSQWTLHTTWTSPGWS